MDPKKEAPEWVRQFGLFSLIVGEVVGSVGGGFLVGYLAAKHFGLPLWIAAIPTILGLALAMIRIYQQANRLK